jgi:hypothetical protein
MVLALTSKSLMSRPDCPWRQVPTRTPEAHFDFTLSSSPPPEYLDALEVAPLKGPYSTAAYECNHGEMADAVWSALTQKAVSYGQSTSRLIHLLLYSTHLPFRLDSGVLDILSFNLSCCDRGLTSVVYAAPDDSESAEVIVVHPRPPQDLVGFSLRKARARRCLIANFSAAVSDGESVTVPLGRAHLEPP